MQFLRGSKSADVALWFGAGGVGQVLEHLRDFSDVLVDPVGLGGQVVVLNGLLKVKFLLVVEAVFVGLGEAGGGTR